MWGLPWWLSSKESVCNAGDIGDTGSIPGREDPWRMKWKPTPVILPVKSYGQRSLAGYSPWGHKDLDMTERLMDTHAHTTTYYQMTTHLDMEFRII